MLIIFYISAFIALSSALALVFTKNQVHGALYLMLTFIATAVIWLLLEAEFLALLLILLYVGAVIVLFLFVIMMLEQHVVKRENKWYLLLALGLIVMFAAYLFYNMQSVASLNLVQQLFKACKVSNIKDLAILLYSRYIVAIELAGMLLLAAMLGAIAITFRAEKRRKLQNVCAQVKGNNRVKLINERI